MTVFKFQMPNQIEKCCYKIMGYIKQAKFFYEIKPEGYFFAQNAWNSNLCNKVKLHVFFISTTLFKSEAQVVLIFSNLSLKWCLAGAYFFVNLRVSGA